MSEKMPKQKSEKNMKKNTTKTRRPKVGKLVKKYIKRIYNITGINPMEMVKGKDGKMIPKNINIVRKLVHRKFSHLDSHGLNKHIKAFYDEEYKNPSLTREFEPFGSNITNDISNLIERFNTNVPFIKPNVIKSKRKYDEFGIPLPIEVTYDYDDMRFDKYSGIKNDVRRYAVDIVNEVFKDVRGEQSDNMRTNIINSIHNIKLETDPNESREDIANRYKEAILKIVNDIIPYLYTLRMNDDGDVVKNQLNELKQKLIDRLKDDNFDVDDDPIENYLEAVEYGIGKMMSNKLTDDLKTDLDDIEYVIIFDEDREYGDDRIDTIYQKLKHFSENITLKQIDGIVVDRELRRKYHDVIPKIKEYLLEGIKKYFSDDDDTKYNNMNYIYNTYLVDTDAINNAAENTADKEVDLLRDINKSIDTKGGLRDKIVEEAKNTFNELGQTTRKTDRKNIDHNMIANIIANKLDGMNDVRIDTIREVTKDVLDGIKGKADSKISKSLAEKTRDIMAFNIADNIYKSDEFDIQYRKPINKLYDIALADAVRKHMDFGQQLFEYIDSESFSKNKDNEEDEPLEEVMIPQTLRRHRKRRDRSYEMLPPEQQADLILREAANKHQDVIKNVIMDGKEEHQDDEKQLELSESSESSTIKSVNEEEEEEREEEDLEEEFGELSDKEELGDDKNTSNEMSEIIEMPRVDALNDGITKSGFVETSQTETPTLQDVIDAQSKESSLSQAQSTKVPIMSIDRNDPSTLLLGMNNITSLIPALQYAQSATDTNNILGGIVSIFKELPNGMDDEIANRLSEAVGPDGKKLFESKEEAARFIAKMRALNGNRLSSIKGGGQNHAIQLNITNQVVSNMPRKPFIVDTHPIPYQY